MTIELEIKQKALDLGFDAVGITTADPVDTDHVAYFQQWLEKGYAAEMGYMHRNMDKRFYPGKLLTSAKSVICVALNYRSECGRTSALREGKQDACPTLRIARFAQYEDYHPFIKDRLFRLAEYIGDVGVSPAIDKSGRDGRAPSFKACVDSVPIAERALAQRAGLGFIGRNHMLINPELGSQILLGELITTLELEPDESCEKTPCGDCGRCIRACPTSALGFDGSFDARKCISYQTIEAPVVPPSLAVTRNTHSPDEKVKNNHNQPNLQNCRLEAGVTSYIFGCDECILACPHEMGKPARKNMDFQYHPEWEDFTPEQIQSMTESEFQKTFANSGFIRLGLDRLKRNCKSSSFSL